MPTLMVHSSGPHGLIPASDARAIERSLRDAYARQRIEEILRAVLEDALSPARLEVPPWHDDAVFEAEFARAVTEMADETTDLVAEHLAILLETAPPRLAVRLAAASRFVDHA
jgi:hypothetical protein